MKFNFSRSSLSKREHCWERFFEILPGASSWSILIGMTLFSFYQPIVAALFIIAFDLYWLMKLFYMTICLVVSYVRLSCEYKTQWMRLVTMIDTLAETGLQQQAAIASGTLREKVGIMIHNRELTHIHSTGQTSPRSTDIYHLVVIPVLKETKSILEPSIVSLTRSTFPVQRLIVVLAVEERASLQVKNDAKSIKERYQGFFYDLLLIYHPDGMSGEARVKGANATHAARKTADYVREKNIPLENITVSCFDADTVIHPDYFSCLTYYFQITPDRDRASFQPIPVYHNNIWEAHSFARLLDIGSSFFQLIEATNPEKLVTFSSHSMSFKALVDIGYWPVDIISDDSAIFWKAFIYFDGRYRAVPMYITVSMDVVDAGTLKKTAVSVYRQKRRWAWGVENFPLVMRAFRLSTTIPWFTKFRYAVKLYENHVSWSTWPFLLGIIGWLPVLVASREFSSSVLFYNAPRITQIIFHLASLSLLITILLSLCLLPASKTRYLWLKRIGHALEWILIPLVSLLFSALPALDAQTRLMIGKYMEFAVTDKIRKKKKTNPVQKQR